MDVRDYRELYRKTRTVEPLIRKELRKQLRAAGKIGADAAKVKIKEMHSTATAVRTGHRRHFAPRAKRPTGLRATIAGQIRVSVGAKDVTIRSGARGLIGHNAANLPKDIDRGVWSHPTFGHAPHVVQTGIGYFKREIESKRETMTDEVAKVLDEVARHVM